MIIAESWYESGTVWAALGVGVAVVVGIVTLVMTYRFGKPSRRLYIGMRTSVPLLAAPPDARSDLELLYRKEKLKDPYLIELQITSRGRKDIPSSAFDSGEPVHLSLAASIIEILRTNVNPESLPIPTVELGEREVRVGPSLFKKRQTLVITILTDGQKPVLTCKSSLIDVQISSDPPQAIGLFLGTRVILGAIASLVIWALVIPAWLESGFKAAAVVFLVASLIAHRYCGNVVGATSCPGRPKMALALAQRG